MNKLKMSLALIALIIPVSYTHLPVARKHYRHTWESVPLQIVIAEVCLSLFSSAPDAEKRQAYFRYYDL